MRFQPATKAIAITGVICEAMQKNPPHSSHEQQLRQELGQLHHELRRARDSLERDGPGSPAQQLVKRLQENIRLCEQQLQRFGKRD